MDIRILTDSTCDLPPKLMAEYGITVLPIPIQLGEETFYDREQVSPQDIFDRVVAGEPLPTTAAISPGRYREAFETLSPTCDALLCVTIGSGFSSCYQNALIAAEDFPRVRVVDSQGLSSAQGIVVLSAARLAQDGLSPAEILERLEELIPRMEASFILDGLTYMKKGGRCSSVAALGANLLKLKPCIELKDGQMTVEKKYRGAMPKVTQQYIRDRLERYGRTPEEEVFVVHSPAEPESIASAWETLALDGRFAQIWDVDAGCTVACHCGPNALGIMFLPEGRRTGQRGSLEGSEAERNPRRG